MLRIGIRAEDKNRFERRIPLVPNDIEALIRQGVTMEVQSSPQRAITDDAFLKAGIPVVPSLKKSQLILGIKEIPVEMLEKEKVYLFFSHVIKGQTYNMPMLQRMIDLKATLIDYERVTDNQKRRLIFFGRHAGLAGMINSLWSLGRRFLAQGIETPFAQLKQALNYPDLAAAKSAVATVGTAIAKTGLPKSINPLVIGITGYGHVAKGAWEIADLLPLQAVTPGDLQTLSKSQRLSGKTVFQVRFKENDCVIPKDPAVSFTLKDYYAAGSTQYISCFERYLPHLTLLVNCNYWDDRYPRLVTKAALKKLWQASSIPKLTVIGDIACDVEGAIECTVKPTYPDKPVYLFNPDAKSVTNGFKGNGVLVMAVEILPTELPLEASRDFSRILRPYIPLLAHADFNGSPEELKLPSELKRAMILHQGALMPDYTYLRRYLKS